MSFPLIQAEIDLMNENCSSSDIPLLILELNIKLDLWSVGTSSCVQSNLFLGTLDYGILYTFRVVLEAWEWNNFLGLGTWACQKLFKNQYEVKNSLSRKVYL